LFESNLKCLENFEVSFLRYSRDPYIWTFDSYDKYIRSGFPNFYSLKQKEPNWKPRYNLEKNLRLKTG